MCHQHRVLLLQHQQTFMNVFKKLPNDMTMLPSKQDTVAVMSSPFPIFFHTIIIYILFLSLHTLGNSATGILSL